MDGWWDGAALKNLNWEEARRDEMAGCTLKEEAGAQAQIT